MKTSSHGLRRKPPLSAHEKEVRVLSGLFMAGCFVVAGICFWVGNRISYGIH